MKLSQLYAVGVLVLFVVKAFAWSESNGFDCCPHCGCHNLTKVCRMIPEIKKVPKVEYSSKCDDFCLPGRSHCVGTQCVTDCNGCCKSEKVYEPNCGRVRMISKLVKTTTMVEKSSFKCVVETICEQCGGNCDCQNSPVPCARPAPSGAGGQGPPTVPAIARVAPVIPDPSAPTPSTK